MSKKADRHRRWVLYRLDVLASEEGLDEADLEAIHRTGQYSSWLFSARVKELLADKLVLRIERKHASGRSVHHYALTRSGRGAVAALSGDDRDALATHFDFTEPRLEVLSTLAAGRTRPEGVAGKELGGKSARAEAKTLAWAGFVEVVTENVPGLGNFYRLTDAGAALLERGRKQVAQELAAEKIANRLRSDAKNVARAEAKRPAALKPLERVELFGEIVTDLEVGELGADEVLVRVDLEGQSWLVRLGHETFVAHRPPLVIHRAVRATGMTPDGEVRLQVETEWCVTVMEHGVTIIGPVAQAQLQQAIDVADRQGRPQWSTASVDATGTLQWPTLNEQKVFQRWVTVVTARAERPRRTY